MGILDKVKNLIKNAKNSENIASARNEESIQARKFTSGKKSTYNKANSFINKIKSENAGKSQSSGWTLENLIIAPIFILNYRT